MDSLNKIYKIIHGLVEERGITDGKLCSDLGFSRNFTYSLKNNPEKTLHAVTAQKVADYFGVSVSYILGEGQKETPVPEDEQRKTPSLEGLDDVVLQIVEKLSVMSESEKSRALGYVDSLIANREKADVLHQ